MSLKLYFLRHGQTPMSREDHFCGSGLDPELTTDGAEMAAAFAEAYQTMDWAAVYSSPLRRTIATAAPLCQALGIEIHRRDGLAEIAYGEWEGQSKEQINAEYHDDYIRWSTDPSSYAPTGGETSVEIERRGLEVVEEIQRDHRTGNVLVVSHKATIRIILCSLLGIDVARFRHRLLCPVASVSTIEFTEHGPLLHVLANRSHLNARLISLAGT